MGFKDLREFIAKVDSLGGLKTLEGADLNLEIGALTEISAASPTCPLLLFDKIKGSKPGYRLVSNLLHTESRLALALGVSPELRGVPLVKVWKEKLSRMDRGLPPTPVKNAPVKQNLLNGEQVNLFDFPCVTWHELDGGPYLAGAITVMKDPDGEWVNLGIYRLQVQDKNTVSLYIEPGKHGGLLLQKYWAKGQAAPVAVCLGNSPALFIASTLFVPLGVSEYDVAGLINKEPVEVTNAELTGLPVPANSEVVLEGYVSPPQVESLKEGPFGEATGYYASGSSIQPVIKIKSIMHRDNPIIQGAPPMRPLPGLWHFPVNYRCVTLWNDLERCGIPDIQGVWQHGYGMMVISLKQKYAGHAKQALLIASGSRSANIIRFIVTVDEDVDPYNVYEVMWAIGTRCDPEHDIDIVRDGWSEGIDPMVTAEQKKRRDMTTAKTLINACRPKWRRDDFAPVVAVSPELKAQMLEKWGEMLN
jgi:UbiD family decarboxylase